MAKKAKKRKYSKGAAKNVGRARNAQEWKIRPESQKQEAGDRDRAFGSAKERRQGPEEEAIKEIIASQSDEGSAAGAETIQSSSSSSGPDSSILRGFWPVML